MHPGIELRITTPAGVVVQCDSDFAHYSTTFRGVPPGQWYTLLRHLGGSPPLLDDGLVPAVAELAAVLTIEIRAIELEDADVPDDPGELFDDEGQADDEQAAARARAWAAIERARIDRELDEHDADAEPMCSIRHCPGYDQGYSDGHTDGAALTEQGRRRRWPWSRGDR